MSWLEKCYSRMLIDNHITDLNPRFMSRFDPAEYVRMLKLSGVESSMVYACDHNGNSYYPTKVGHMHAGLNGRDIFGETVRGLADAGIIPVAYHTIIHHNWSAKTHPQWQMRDRTGNNHGNRYYWSCPNNDEYVEFCCTEISEILAYPVAGIFIDMTFWPTVCCCDSCRAKFRAATGAEIPEVIDWRDPAWVRFQRWREDSMAEYAMKLTGHARKARPGVTVTHQFSPVLHGWFLGASSGIAEASDYTSGDFYGGRLQQRVGAKAFSAYTNMQPYEFMTSRCVSLHLDQIRRGTLPACRDHAGQRRRLLLHRRDQPRRHAERALLQTPRQDRAEARTLPPGRRPAAAGAAGGGRTLLFDVQLRGRVEKPSAPARTL